MVHRGPFVLCPTAQIATPAVFFQEGDQTCEEVAQLTRIGFVW
jgi:hypothetical protein